MDKLLFVSYQDPYGQGGGAFASHAFLKAFSILFSGNVDLVIADSCQSQSDNSILLNRTYRVPPRNMIKKIKSLFIGGLNRYSDFLSKILKVNYYDFIVISGSLAYCHYLKEAKSNGTKIITIHHNYEVEYFKDNVLNPIERFFWVRNVKRVERLSYHISNYNMFLTRSDIEIFQKEYGQSSAKNCLMGIFESADIPYKDKEISTSKRDFMVFVITGTLSTVQGEDGVCWFLDNFYSLLPEKSVLYIAGANPSKKICSKCANLENVILIANPQDMNEVAQKADIYICPTRLGGGLKLRIMDGLRLGMPIITHKCSSRGYDKFFNLPYFQIFENQDQFRKCIRNIVSLNYNSSVKKDIISNYSDFFSFDSGLKRLRSFIFE